MKLQAFYHSTVEASSSCPLTQNTPADPEQWSDVYVVTIAEALQKGDIIEAIATTEFTNNTTIIAGIVWAIGLFNEAPAPGAVIPQGGSILMSQPTGEDVDPNYVHHLAVCTAGVAQITANDAFPAGATVRLRVTGQSTAAAAGEVIDIMQGYGQMWVKVFRNA